MTIPPPPAPPPPPPLVLDGPSLVQIALMSACFVAAFSILFLLFRFRKTTSANNREAAVTAVFGLFLGARFSLHANGIGDWLMVIGVGGMMSMLAWRSLIHRSSERPFG